jgi:formate-nitrite transporter family protein
MKLRLSALALGTTLLVGCASSGTDQQGRSDPLEGFNRTMYNFNFNVLDPYIVRPVAVAWRDYVPQPARNGLSNFTGNLEEPAVMVNYFLQGDPYQGMVHFTRFFLNTILGMGGFIDVAGMANPKLQRTEPHRFGSTLGHYGVGYGPYVQDGEKELERDAMALLWSAIAAGLSMGASLLAKGIFQVELEGVPGSFLLENLGYTFGFIIVIMARQQLFTENTVTAVLPVMQKPTMSNVGLLIRLWGVVLLGNILGTGIAAWAFEYMPIFNEETRDAFVKIGMDVMKNTPSEMFANAIISGWLIATMVWMFPAAGAAKIVVIILMTWLIALGDTTHIVVGSVEILYLVFNGTLHWSDFIWPFALPTLAGNICGGTFIFALMSHAQIRNDMSNKRKAEARQKAERAENIKKNYKNPA